MIKRTLLIAGLAILLGYISNAQTQRIVESISLTSEILNEEREIKVYLPEDYDETKPYPVFYITDGSSSNFDVAKSYLDMLSNPTYDVIPQAILVGIVHNVRNDDLNVFERESGIKFKNYLFQEVIPYIDETYNTSGFNSIIGHSNGAEYNHFLLLDKENPFRGFISISTNFNTDVRARLTSFFKNYDGKQLYYFISTGDLDPPSRTAAANDFAELYKSTPNKKIAFIKQNYAATHMSLVPLSLSDGLRFVFQDYNNIDKYPSIVDYAEHYLKDMKDLYGLEVEYDVNTVDGVYLVDIIMNKKTDEYEYWVDFVNEHGLSFEGYVDHVNRANQYFVMGSYDKTIEFINKAADAIDSVEHMFFYTFIPKAIEAYAKTDRMDEVVDYLTKAKEVLPEKYKIFVSYRLARFSIEKNQSVEKGQEAIEYCRTNYRKNRLFSLEDLQALEQQI